MKRLLLFCACLCVLLAGCESFEHRAKKNPALFASLSPEQREKLSHGVVSIGDTPDMVYLALGTADEKFDTTTTAGTETVWVFYSYHQEYEGNFQTGFHRHLLYDPVHKVYRVYFEPLYTDVYSEQAEENIRVTFRAGKVVSIEQPKRA